MPDSVTSTRPTALAPLAPRAILRFDLVRRKVLRLSPATVLEIGCGLGAVGSRLARLAEYLGVEPDPTSFATAHQRIEDQGGTVLNGTDEIIPAGKTFDLVCAFEVLEHIEDDEAALDKWCEFIKPGGNLMLSVPAFQKRFGPMDTAAGHFRRYSPEDLQSALVKRGLVDVEVTVYAWPLGYALEAVRNRLDAKRLASSEKRGIEELTAASGRIYQPAKKISGLVVRVGTLPFRYLQRLQPKRGTGLVAVAKKPATSVPAS